VEIVGGCVSKGRRAAGGRTGENNCPRHPALASQKTQQR